MILENRSEIDIYVEQHSLIKSIALHLIPGILMVSFYIVIGPIIIDFGLPSLFAFIISVVCTSMPFQIIYLLYQGKKKNGVISLEGLFPYREKISKKEFFITASILIIWGSIWLGFIPMFWDKLIIKNSFQWLPEWFNITGFMENIHLYSKNILVSVLILGTVFTGIIVPYVEELYFRGYLLPRITRYKEGAILINSILFSVYHFHQPWGLLNRVVFLLPMVYVVWTKRNVKIGITVHCIIRAIPMLSAMLLVFF